MRSILREAGLLAAMRRPRAVKVAKGGSVFSSECPAVIAGSMLGIRPWVTYEKRLSTSADMMLISSEVLA
jgi:hypothetical protein